MNNIFESDLVLSTKVLVSNVKKQKPLFAFGLCLLFFTLTANAQQDTSVNNKKNIDKSMPLKKADSSIRAETDTVTKKIHSPKKATYYAMALPGLGQAYNKKYWKIPIIYAGFGTLGYFIKRNNDDYKTFKNAYKYVLEDETGPPPNEMVERYDADAEKLRTIKDYYRRNLELSYILTGALYLLQVLDATVDAHFFNFDVSKDLSLDVEPYFAPNHGMPIHASKGITLRLKL